MSKVTVVRFKSPPEAAGKAQCQAVLNHAFDDLAKAQAHSTKAFLRALFSGGVVGIKTNCLAAQIATSKPLVDAFADILKAEAGVRDNDIVVWERSNAELSRAGFKLNASSFGRRCLGTDSSGVGYYEDFMSAGKVTTLVSSVMTSMIDHSVNMPVLKDHSIAGLSGGLKNMYGAIRNPNKYHMNNCSPYVADVNALQPLRTKQRLTIVDALRVQYDKGPGFVPQYNYAYGGIIVSRDPVAADTVALEIVERLRKAKGLGTLASVGRPVKYLASAKHAGLGENDLKKIELSVFTIDASGKPAKGGLL